MAGAASIKRLDRRFYRQDAVTVARALLGQRLVHLSERQMVAGTIVETEAYLGAADKAAHSFGGRRTRRTETMFADGGTAYIYLNYGIHFLFNVVVGEIDRPEAVLIRAVEPTHGVDVMRARRPRAKRDTDLCSGPGKVGAAFAFHTDLDRTDLVESHSLYIERLRARRLPEERIVSAPRIGVDYAGEWAAKPLRFYVLGSPHVSALRRSEA